MEQTKGVSAVDMSARNDTMTVHFDPDLVTVRGIEERTREACGLLAARYCHRTLVLEGLDCADCARSIERALARRPGVLYSSVNFASSRLFVEMDCAEMPIDVVTSDVRALGYQVWTEEEYRTRLKNRTPRPFYLRSPRARLTLVSFAFLLAGAALWLATSPPHAAAIALLSVAIAVGGYPVARNAWNTVVRTRNVDMNVLMTVATIGAAAVGSWVEAALVVALFGLGETLEGWAVDRTRGSIQQLMNLSPDEALVRHEDHEETMPVDQVQVGEIVVVKPGARVPLDGVVVKGHSSVDESPITGESLPRAKQENDLVYAGTINQRGSLEVRVASLARDSTLARLINMVEEAQGQKAPTQRWVDSFARYYTPVVMSVALLTAVLPPLLLGAPWSDWIYKALALLILACPCALVISTPVSIVSAIGAASRQGVLIKGGAHLEAAGTVTAVAFDKTGTLTEGTPRVTAILSFNGATQDEVLAFAAAVERDSEHPLADAVLHAAAARGVDVAAAHDFESLPGRGARAGVNGSTFYVGNTRLFEEIGVSLDGAGMATVSEHQERGETVVLVGTADEVIGAVSVADQVRPLSRSAVAGLRAAGVRYVTMLTGDNRQTAAAVAADLGLDDYQAELLPEHKVQAVREIAAQHGPVAMIGDGVNDAPALAAATVGIAMGAAGTDTALETADIALMADDLSKVPFAIELSRATRATVRQNITFALALKVVTLLLVFPGWLTLWMAVLADTGGSLIVIGNGLRLVRYGRRERSAAGPEPAGLPARRRARTSPSTAVAAGCSLGGCACTISGHAEPGGHDHDRAPVAAGNRGSA
jgi:Cd2+/Zn2+-exporting ATPase